MAHKPLPLIVNELIDVFKLEGIDTVPDILEVYGLLGYVLGMSIEGFPPDKEISYETMKSLYLQDESVGAALMLQGQLIRSWVEPWQLKNKKEKTRKDKQDA